MTIKLWRLNKEQEYRCFKTLQGHEHEVSTVEYVNPSGNNLVSCSRDQTIRIWDSNNGFLLMTLQQHNEWVRRVTQTFDGKLLASASKDETVIVWSLERILQNLNNSKSVDQTDFILTIIDEHEHVIDCIKFAPEAACKTIQFSDYNKGGGTVIGD
jgi:WD40 repeat protein